MHRCRKHIEKVGKNQMKMLLPLVSHVWWSFKDDIVLLLQLSSMMMRKLLLLSNYGPMVHIWLISEMLSQFSHAAFFYDVSKCFLKAKVGGPMNHETSFGTFQNHPTSKWPIQI